MVLDALELDAPVALEEELEQAPRTPQHHLVHAELVHLPGALGHAEGRDAPAQLVEELVEDERPLVFGVAAPPEAHLDLPAQFPVTHLDCRPLTERSSMTTLH